MTEKKYDYVRAQVTQEQKDEIKQMASAAGVSVSDFILAKVYGKDLAKCDALEEYVSAIGKLGNDFNKIITSEIENKIIYDEEIFELMAILEKIESLANKALRKFNKSFKT